MCPEAFSAPHHIVKKVDEISLQNAFGTLSGRGLWLAFTQSCVSLPKQPSVRLAQRKIPLVLIGTLLAVRFLLCVFSVSLWLKIHSPRRYREHIRESTGKSELVRGFGVVGDDYS